MVPSVVSAVKFGASPLIRNVMTNLLRNLDYSTGLPPIRQ
jgi:hypothetical protein